MANPQRRRILLFNPNTTASMTERMVPAAQAVADPLYEVIGDQSTDGPASIEGYFDEALSVPAMLTRFAAAPTEGIDACIVGCFDDTGLDAARCLLDGPVVGLCQSACIAASQIATSFAIITTLRRSVPALEDLVLRYGFERQCKAVMASDIPVLDLEADSDAARTILIEAGSMARDKLGAEALVLGCAGMVDLAAGVSEALQMPVIEPVSAATAQAVALLQMGAKTSKVNAYAPPLKKAYSGASSAWVERL